MSEQVTEAGHHAPKVKAFLAAIKVCPSITRAARAADIRPGLHYRRIKSDPVYKAAFEEAWEIGVGACEDKAVEAAVIGYEEPVIYQGQLQYTALRTADGQMVLDEEGQPKLVPFTVFRPNPTLHMFVLRGAKPEKYRERWSGKVEVSDKRFNGTLEDLLVLLHKTTQGDDDDE